MILTCPSCDTRYSVDRAKFPAVGRTVRCAKCGHSWHQPGEGEAVPEAAPEISAETAPAPAPTEAPAPDPFPVNPSPTRALAPAAVSAVRYRQGIAVIWPQSAGVYSSLGLKVNASGIDFRQVGYKRETEDRQVVLAVSGVIVNAGSRQLPVPQTVRVTLSDVSNHELYHWTFKPSATVLGPGQSLPFMTRRSSPPAAARHLEVRFAKDGP